MTDTLKILTPLITEELKDKTLEQLAALYQVSPDSKILATAFSKVYKLAILVSDKYYGLEMVDLESWCLEKLDLALRTYNFQNKFTTYFSVLYSNKLREETENNNRKKRKCILQCIDELINVGVEDTYNFISMLLPDNLTNNERKYCMLASLPDNYSNSDIAEIMGVTRATICNIRKSLKIKCGTLQN